MPDYLVLVATLGGMVVFGLNGFVIGPVIAAIFSRRGGSSPLQAGRRRRPASTVLDRLQRPVAGRTAARSRIGRRAAPRRPGSTTAITPALRTSAAVARRGPAPPPSGRGWNRSICAAGVAQARQFDHRRVAQLQPRAGGQRQQVEPAGGDVLAQLAGQDGEAAPPSVRRTARRAAGAPGAGWAGRGIARARASGAARSRPACASPCTPRPATSVMRVLGELAEAVAAAAVDRAPRGGAISRACTASASRSALRAPACASRASTITRTTGSVPLARISTRPRAAQLGFERSRLASASVVFCFQSWPGLQAHVDQRLREQRHVLQQLRQRLAAAHAGLAAPAAR